MAQNSQDKKEAAANAKAPESNGYEEISEEGFEGRVVVFDEVDQELEGVYIGEGRSIGTGSNQNGTHKVIPIEGQEEEVLIPRSHVLNKKIEKAQELHGNSAGQFQFLLKYRGLKTPSSGGNSYHDWSLYSRKLTAEGAARLPLG